MAGWRGAGRTAHTDDACAEERACLPHRTLHCIQRYLAQTDVVALCKKENILVQAYASLGGQDSSPKHWASAQCSRRACRRRSEHGPVPAQCTRRACLAYSKQRGVLTRARVGWHFLARLRWLAAAGWSWTSLSAGGPAPTVTASASLVVRGSGEAAPLAS